MEKGLTYVTYYPEYIPVYRMDILFDLITIFLVAMMLLQIACMKYRTRELIMFRRRCG